MGSGFRTWTAGETVTASNVQNYLQEQTVMVFASAAARDAAITSPEEGMLTYLSDTDAFTWYNGSAWGSLSTLTDEDFQDLVGGMIGTAVGLTVTYDDAGGALDFTVSTEWVQDLAGAMWTSNTATAVTVTYQDSDGTIDIDASLVLDTTPQLGGQLDVNGQAIGDGTLELLTFTEDASAVNHLNVENEATGNGPILSSTGDDTDVDLHLATKGAGVIKADADVSLEAGWIRNVKGSGYTVTTASGTSFTPALTTSGNVFHWTATGNATIAAPTGADGTDLDLLVMVLEQDSTGSRTITLNTAFIPAGGSAPTFSTDGGDIDIVTAVTVDGGTEWLYWLTGGGGFAS